jgi:hypothetical protein
LDAHDPDLFPVRADDANLRSEYLRVASYALTLDDSLLLPLVRKTLAAAETRNLLDGRLANAPATATPLSHGHNRDRTDFGPAEYSTSACRAAQGIAPAKTLILS